MGYAGFAFSPLHSKLFCHGIRLLSQEEKEFDDDEGFLN